MTTKFAKLFGKVEEQVTPLQASISGTIPDWLDGELIRVGPGIFELESGFTMNHFCDGYSVMYKFTIANGKVEFTLRHLNSEALEKAQRIGKPGMVEFATKAHSDPSKSILAKAIGTLLPDVTDNCNGNIVKLGNSYFAVTDTCNLRLIDPKTLTTGDKIDLFKQLGVHIVCAHTLKDHNGDSYSMATSLLTGLKYNLIKIPHSTHSGAQVFKDAKIIASISSRWKTCVSFYHSFALTENYVVFIDQPYIMSGVKLLASQFKGKSMKDCLDWEPDQLNRFFLIEKSSGKVLSTKYRSRKPLFYFHYINAYEENNQIVLDMLGNDSPDIMETMYLKNLKSGNYDTEDSTKGRRFIIPIIENIKTIKEGENLVKNSSHCEAVRQGDYIELSDQLLASSPHEFPTYNPKYLGRKYRYYYATGLYYTSDNAYSVVKVDVETCEVKKWFAGETQIPCEPLFISRPDSSAEDDGILLVGITCPDDSSKLVILDAATMEYIGSAAVPNLLPLTLHGIFINKT